MSDDKDKVCAVSVKIPDFWIKSPEVWFARIEAQFGTKGIVQDQTKYDYVVSALDVNTAEEISAILLSPPQQQKYENLKKFLIKTFGKTQAQKDAELLNLNGLGDRRPTALLRRINALNDDPNTLKRALFMANLPSEITTILAAQNLTNLEELADAADHIWEAKKVSGQIAAVSHAAQETPPDQEQEKPPGRGVEAFARNRRHFPRTKSSTPAPSNPNQSNICFFHSKFGMEARRCLQGCKFAALIPRADKPRPHSGNGPVGC